MYIRYSTCSVNYTCHWKDQGCFLCIIFRIIPGFIVNIWINYSIQIIISEILFIALQRLNTYFVKVAQSYTLILGTKVCNLNTEDHNLKLADKGHINYDELNKIYHKFFNNCCLCFGIRLEIKSLFVETIFFNLFSWMRFCDRSCFSGQYKAIQIER